MLLKESIYVVFCNACCAGIALTDKWLPCWMSDVVEWVEEWQKCPNASCFSVACWLSHQRAANREGGGGFLLIWGAALGNKHSSVRAGRVTVLSSYLKENHCWMTSGVNCCNQGAWVVPTRRRFPSRGNEGLRKWNCLLNLGSYSTLSEWKARLKECTISWSEWFVFDTGLTSHKTDKLPQLRLVSLGYIGTHAVFTSKTR